MASLRQVCYPSQQQQLNRYFKNTTKHSLKRDVFLLSEWPHQCVSLLSVSVDRPHCLLCALVSSDGSSRVSHFAGSLVARFWGEPSVSEPQSRPRSGRARSSCLSVHSLNLPISPSYSPPSLAIGRTCRLSCSVIVIVLLTTPSSACLPVWSIKCSLSIELGCCWCHCCWCSWCSRCPRVAVSAVCNEESAAFQFHIITFLMTPPLCSTKERKKKEELQHSMMERINRKEQGNSTSSNTSPGIAAATKVQQQLTGWLCVHTVSANTSPSTHFQLIALVRRRQHCGKQRIQCVSVFASDSSESLIAGTLCTPTLAVLTH